MRISIDWDLCIGSGQCLVAGEGALALVEALGEHRAMLVDAAVPDFVLLAAAKSCPTMAIRLTDDDGAAVY